MGKLIRYESGGYSVALKYMHVHILKNDCHVIIICIQIYDFAMTVWMYVYI